MRKLILALGLMTCSGFGINADAAPICATTASQIETSSSQLLKEMLKLLRNKAPGLAFRDRNLEITLNGECFRIEHAMARMMPDASTFCPGTMPAPIRVAMDNAPSTPAKTRAQLANQ